LADMTKSNFKISLLTFILLIITPFIISASEFMARDGMIISRADSVFDDIYLFGNNAEVYGYVEGDVFAFGYDVETNGDITESVNLFAYNVVLGGDVGNSARLFGYQIDVDALVHRNVLAFGQRVDIGRNTEIFRDITCGAERINFDGIVHGDAELNGDVVSVSGIIEGDLIAKGGEISIIAPTTIKGDFICTSVDEPYIDDDVIIEGETDWEPPKEKDTDEEDEGSSAFGAVFRFVLFLMAFITGLALVILFKRHTNESAIQLQTRFWHTLAIGFLAWVIFIGGSLILLVLIIGIPLSILLFTVGMVLFYIGKIYVSIFIGRLLIGLVARGKKVALGWELLLGLIILSIVFQIPGLGVLIYIITFILGTGAAIAGYLSMTHPKKSATATTL